jgi:hypothetical protein
VSQEARSLRPTAVPRAATLGLFAAWVVHDLEELLTMAAWTSRQAHRLRWARPMSQAHVNVGISLMGVVVAARRLSKPSGGADLKGNRNINR